MTWIPDLRLDAIYEPRYGHRVGQRVNATGSQMELLHHIDATTGDLAALVRLGNTPEIRAAAVEMLVRKHPSIFRK